MITPIDSWSVDQITSGQVVTSLSSAIKELIENSLDSGASVVDIKLQNHGRDGVSVTDNGHGIEPEDFAFIARKHATSKLGSFSDLSKVTSLGFRGEALASICALADVTITTNTGKEPTGHELGFNHEGAVVSDTRVPAPKGTVVTVSNIFEQLPVRRKTFERNSSREFAKTVALVQEYAILSPARITLEHVLKNRSSITLRSQGAKLMQRIACVYGAMRTKTLQQIEFADAEVGWRISGYISKPVFGMGDSASTCQLLAVNGRPTQQPRIKRAVVEIYRQYNLTEQPFFVLDISMPPDLYDVNVSPDKRSLLLHHEDEVVSNVRFIIEDAFANSEHSVPRASQAPASPPAKRAKQSLLSFASYAGTGNVISQQKESRSTHANTDVEHDDTVLDDSASASLDTGESTAFQDSPASSPIEEKGALEDSSNGLPDKGSGIEPGSQPAPTEEPLDGELDDVEMDGAEADDSEADDSEEHQGCCSRSRPDEVTNDCMSACAQSPSSISQYSSPPSSALPHGPSKSLDRASSQPSSQPASQPASPPGSQPSSEPTSPQSPQPGPQADPHATVQSRSARPEAQERVQAQADKSRESAHRLKTLNTTVDLPLDLADVQSALEEASRSNEKSMKRVQTLAIDEEGVEERLQLSIHKQDFETMEVVGQFNLGFILVVNRKAKHDDLFVVDQHASDEIYNFERLQSSTTLSRQPLVVPHVLELSAVEELTMQEHEDVFANNGFKISFKPENPPGRQCVLESVPFSKSTVFDEKDVFELLSRLKEEPNQPWLRCSKLRAMFAMRACRSSIMIGRPLSKTTMETVVRHMGSLDKPWNCPHGRPTLRHITSLS